MKKIILLVSILLFSSPITYADIAEFPDEAWERIEFCSLSWENYKAYITESWSKWGIYWRSDTSNRGIPEAYQWPCADFPKLSLNMKSLIHSKLKNTRIPLEEIITRVEKLFIIEMNKNYTDMFKISIYHHIVAMIWYDFIILEPDTILIWSE